MHLLSAVVITKNEEKNIALCIEALQQVADEIIIVDSFSTDRTAEICAGYKVRFYQQEWLGFGPQKNFGIAKASYNIILSSDADEILGAGAIKAINALKVSGFEGVYALRLVQFYFGKFIRYGIEAPNYRNRIFDKTKVHWNENDVHEKLVIPQGTRITRIQEDVAHYSYHSIEQFIAKSNLYTTLGAQLLYRNNKHSYLFKLICSPAFTFIKGYFIKGGFREGMHGLILAKLNAQTTFLKYAKLRQLCIYGVQ